MRDFLSNRNNLPILYTFGAYLALILGALILNRKDTEVFQVVNLFVPFCALYALGTALSRFGSKEAENSPEIWGRIILGLFFWTIAEAIWAVYALQSWAKNPVTHAAEALWVLGYVPFIEAMAMRYQNQRTRPGESRLLNLSFVTLALVIPLSYILSIPGLVEMADWETRFTVLARISFSLANFAILPFALLTLFAVGRGHLFKIWGIIAIAFLIRSIVYFLLTYLIPDSFFPGRFATLPSIINSLLHLLMAIGIYGSWLLGQQVALVSQLKLGFIGKDTEIPQFLINTDVNGKIINISRNFLQFTNNSLLERYLGKPIWENINISREEFNRITDICSRGGFVINQDVKVAAGQKNPVPLLLTSVGSLAGEDYFGLDIVLQLPNYSAQAYPLDPESAAITHNILRRTGQQTKENCNYLTEYFIAHIQAFHELVSQAGSNLDTMAMATEVNEAAAGHEWPIRISGKEVTIQSGFDNFDNAELLKALPVLYQIAEQFAIRATSAKSVNEQTQKANRLVSKNALVAAQNFGLKR